MLSHTGLSLENKSHGGLVYLAVPPCDLMLKLEEWCTLKTFPHGKTLLLIVWVCAFILPPINMELNWTEA